MDYKVIYSPNAISDLAEIVRFVAQDDSQAARDSENNLLTMPTHQFITHLSLINYQSCAAVQTFGKSVTRAIFHLLYVGTNDLVGSSRGVSNPGLFRQRKSWKFCDFARARGETPRL